MFRDCGLTPSVIGQKHLTSRDATAAPPRTPDGRKTAGGPREGLTEAPTVVPTDRFHHNSRSNEDAHD